MNTFHEWYEAWRVKLSKIGQPAIDAHTAVLAEQALENLEAYESDPKEVL